MDILVVYLIQSNRPFHELLNPNFQELDQPFHKTFVGMTEEPISLSVLVESRDEVVKKLQKEIRSHHIEFLISLLNNAPRWNLLPFENLDKYPGIIWKILNLAKMSDDKRQMEIQKLERYFAS